MRLCYDEVLSYIERVKCESQESILRREVVVLVLGAEGSQNWIQFNSRVLVDIEKELDVRNATKKADFLS